MTTSDHWHRLFFYCGMSVLLNKNDDDMIYQSQLVVTFVHTADTDKTSSLQVRLTECSFKQTYGKYHCLEWHSVESLQQMTKDVSLILNFVWNRNVRVTICFGLASVLNRFLVSNQSFKFWTSPTSKPGVYWPVFHAWQMSNQWLDYNGMQAEVVLSPPIYC